MTSKVPGSSMFSASITCTSSMPCSRMTSIPSAERSIPATLLQLGVQQIPLLNPLPGNRKIRATSVQNGFVQHLLLQVSVSIKLQMSLFFRIKDPQMLVNGHQLSCSGYRQANEPAGGWECGVKRPWSIPDPSGRSGHFPGNRFVFHWMDPPRSADRRCPGAGPGPGAGSLTAPCHAGKLDGAVPTDGQPVPTDGQNRRECERSQ